MQATSVWYITLIMCQAWHIWVCKTRRVSMFKHPGVIENRTTYYGVFISLAIMVVCVYIPWLQDNVFFTANPPHVQVRACHLAAWACSSDLRGIAKRVLAFLALTLLLLAFLLLLVLVNGRSLAFHVGVFTACCETLPFGIAAVLLD